MEKTRNIKRGIGFLVLLLILGTVVFSVQVFSGKIQTASVSPDLSVSADDAALAAGITDADVLTAGGDVTSEEVTGTHTMNRKTNDAGGFLALLQQNAKYFNTYTVKKYTASKKNIVTDHTIRSQSNPYGRIQVFDFHVSKLTAG